MLKTFEIMVNWVPLIIKYTLLNHRMLSSTGIAGFTPLIVVRCCIFGYWILLVLPSSIVVHAAVKLQVSVAAIACFFQQRFNKESDLGMNETTFNGNGEESEEWFLGGQPS